MMNHTLRVGDVVENVGSRKLFKGVKTIEEFATKNDRPIAYLANSEIWAYLDELRKA